jgi:hypothetical protein
MLFYSLFTIFVRFLSALFSKPGESGRIENQAFCHWPAGLIVAGKGFVDKAI